MKADIHNLCGSGDFAERCGSGDFAERCGSGDFAERCGSGDMILISAEEFLSFQIALASSIDKLSSVLTPLER